MDKTQDFFFQNLLVSIFKVTCKNNFTLHRSKLFLMSTGQNFLIKSLSLPVLPLLEVA